MNFSLEFDGGGSALVDDPAGETERILKLALHELQRGSSVIDKPIHDRNGNKIGRLFVNLNTEED